MKTKLELNILDNNTLYLNFWNWYNGDDVSCQIVDGKLLMIQFDEDGNELPSKEITFLEFVELVKARINAIPE